MNKNRKQAVKGGKHWLKILGPSGDEPLVWDEEDVQSVEDAMNRFRYEVRMNHKAPFRQDTPESVPELHRGNFDPSAYSYVLVPPLQGG